jgi:hypothetical protein
MSPANTSRKHARMQSNGTRRTSIDWFSKKQNTIESSNFGSEFVALKTAMEKLRGMRYKLRMMGFLIEGPTYPFGDNMSVVKNTSAPESVLRKKCNSICQQSTNLWQLEN